MSIVALSHVANRTSGNLASSDRGHTCPALDGTHSSCSCCCHCISAGALLAVGITNCSVQDECDPAYALLCESVNHDDPNVRIGAIMGLGLAYCGTQKAEVQV